MVTHADCTLAVASGDTTETAVGTITVPAGGSRTVIGIWVYAIAGATLTTGEAPTGILRLQSDSVALEPFKIPLAVVSILTSGAIAYEPRIIPVNIPVDGGAILKGYVTMDMAQTGALTVRWGVIYSA